MIDEQGEIAAEPPVDGEWSKLRVGDTWKGRDLYLWLTTNIDVPASWAGRRVLGRFDFGETGAGNNSDLNPYSFQRQTLSRCGFQSYRSVLAK